MHPARCLKPVLLAALLATGCDDGSVELERGADDGTGTEAQGGADWSGHGNACTDGALTGDAEGVIARNWTLEDSNGELISLESFCGRIIYFEEGAFW